MQRGGSRATAHLIGATLLGAFALSAPAAAQSGPTAQPAAGDYETAVQAAIEEFAAGHYLEARALFTKAHELRPTARTLRGLGLAEFELGRYAQAMRMLRRALVDVRNPLTDAHRAEAEALIRKATAYVARYRIALEPKSAELLVDGEPIMLLGDELVLDVGEHRLLVRAPGREDRTYAIDVRGGEEDRLRLALLPTAAIVQEAPEGAEATPAVQPVADGASETEFPTSTLGWVAGGASIVAFGGAVLAWQLGMPAAERWNSDACLTGNRTREQNCSADGEAASTAQTWTVVGLAGGGALAVTAAVLLLMGASPEAPSEGGLACGGTPRGWGVECSLRL